MANDRNADLAARRDKAEGERWSPTQTDDVVTRERPAGERAPRRYDEADDPPLPSDDTALRTTI